MLSTEDYINSVGQQCPHCEEYTELSHKRVVDHGNHLRREVRCMSCHGVWEETFELAGYEEED